MAHPASRHDDRPRAEQGVSAPDGSHSTAAITAAWLAVILIEMPVLWAAGYVLILSSLYGNPSGDPLFIEGAAVLLGIGVPAACLICLIGASVCAHRGAGPGFLAWAKRAAVSMAIVAGLALVLGTAF
ncbi:hypothetical protein [Tsukamurella hominis]|uniref:hypothetical protein n=1 Tax=Tsukamurella hominis TaxID=1970232 RepID=UPI0039EBBE49